MSVVAALAHFCEYHGPCVVMTTQMFSEKREGVAASAAVAGDEPTQPPPVVYGCRQLLAAPGGGGCPVRASCDGCTSVTDTGLLVTNDHARSQSWVSSQGPLAPGLAPAMRQAALRAVSGEVTNPRDGPVFFADSGVLNVFSHGFSLKDPRARGFQRSYSLVVLARDKEHILAGWDGLASDAAAFVKSIKAKAEACYSREFNPAAVFLRDEKCCGKRTSYRPVRNLRDITDDPQVFTWAHRTFVRLLQDLLLAWRERPLVGRPLTDAGGGQEEPGGLAAAAAELCRRMGGEQFRRVAYAAHTGRLRVASCDPRLGASTCRSISFLVPKAARPRRYSVIAECEAAARRRGGLLTLYVDRNGDSEKAGGSELIYSCSGHQEKNNSVVVNKLTKMLQKEWHRYEVLQMMLSAQKELLLSQARLLASLPAHTEARRCLARQGYTRCDEEIFAYLVSTAGKS